MFGYRKNRSTGHDIVDLTDRLKSYLGQNSKVLCICIDASGAFGVISRELIIKTLEKLGGGVRTLGWTQSFLNNRTQYVQIDDVKSETWDVNDGIVQEIRSSSTFYYVGSLTQSLWNEDSYPCQFAYDDIEATADEKAEACIKKGLVAAEKVPDWFDSVGLTMNEKKSEVLGIGFKPRIIRIAGEEVLPSKVNKCLGGYIDTGLTNNVIVKKETKRLKWQLADKNRG